MTTKNFILATDERVLYQLINTHEVCKGISCHNCKCFLYKFNGCNIPTNLNIQHFGAQKIHSEFKKQHLQNIQDHYPELLI